MASLEPIALRCFMATVRAGSIGKAATLLGRTQPAVSQQLRRLEQAAGTPLLQRTSQGVALTPAGEAFRPYAERLLALAAEAQAALTRPTDAMAGRCGIGLLEDIVGSTLPAVLTDLQRVHPGIELEVLVSSGRQMREAFDEGRLQLVLGDPSYMQGLGPRSTTQVRPHWVAAHAFVDADPLPLVLFSPPCRWREPVLDALRRAGRAYRIAFESSSLAAVQAAVRNGVGISPLLPGAIPTGTAIICNGLPAPPIVALALFVRKAVDSDELVQRIADVLWRHALMTWFSASQTDAVITSPD